MWSFEHQEGPLLKIYVLLYISPVSKKKKTQTARGQVSFFLLMERKDKIWVSHYFPEVLEVRRRENLLLCASGFSLRIKKSTVKTHQISRRRRIFLLSPSSRDSDLLWPPLMCQRGPSPPLQKSRHHNAVVPCGVVWHAGAEVKGSNTMRRKKRVGTGRPLL